MSPDPSAVSGAALPQTAGLVAAMRARVAALHAQAERSGIVRDILRRHATRAGYALFLRNLLPAYRALEDGLECHRASPLLRGLAIPGLYRAPAIAADLAVLAADRLPLLPAGARYAASIEAAAAGDGARLIGHAYTRYVGDLSGGQIMRRLLAGSAGVPAAALSMFDFAPLGDADAFRAGYRAAVDAAGRRLPDPDAVAEEAAVAFRLNIDLSVAVHAAVAGATTAAC